MNLNRAMIIGNLTRDPEVRTTANGQTVASFSVATNYSWNDSAGQKQERVEFHNIVTWGKLAEICGQFLGKGRKVYVEGRLQTREWEGQDGQKRNRTEIVCESMIMLDRSPGQGVPGASGAIRREPVSESAQPARPAGAAAQGASDEIRVEDIPF